MSQNVSENELRGDRLYKLWVDNKLDLHYSAGFQTDRVSEAIKGAVPIGQNTPQKCAYGLYAEQISGTSFTTPRVENLRSWYYRVLPAVKHKPFRLIENNFHTITDFSNCKITPAQIRWNPIPIPDKTKSVEFWQGWRTICGSGSADIKTGMAIHVYVCNTSMTNTSLCNADGDLLIVAQEGDLLIRTELGTMEIKPGFIAVIQRGIKFSVFVKSLSRGYIAEVYDSHFILPDLGPIGANGLANIRDFETVEASYENTNEKFIVIQKFLGKFFESELDHSCYDVVGWHGNYAPFRYDLSKYCAINTVTYDHMDPSIFTVLTAPTNHKGVAACDFVIFPPRWMVATNTFRPPYYHRNCMSEYMGNIFGVYEAKKKGFLPGGGSLHSCMSAHGPDAETFELASKEEQTPTPPNKNALAFMFESTYIFKITDYAMDDSLVQKDYNDCWQPLKKYFQLPVKL